MWSKEWEGVLEQVRDFQRLAAPEGELVWFRGHRRACWTLESTVHRYLQPLAAIPGVPPNTLRTFLRDTERTAYQKFRIRAWPLLNAHERSEWGIVFSMRHLGLPSRLLDWTPSFACAVFFAQDGRDPSEDAAVFALRPERLNERTVGEAGIRAVQESLDAPEKPPALAAWHPLRAAANDLPPSPLRLPTPTPGLQPRAAASFSLATRFGLWRNRLPTRHSLGRSCYPWRLMPTRMTSSP